MRKNRNYAKIVDGRVVFAELPLKISYGKDILNPKEEHFIAMGFKKVVRTEKPADTEEFYYTPEVRNINGIPTEVWIEYKIENNEEGL